MFYALYRKVKLLLIVTKYNIKYFNIQIDFNIQIILNTFLHEGHRNFLHV